MAVAAAPAGRVLNPGGWTVLRRFLAAILHPELSPAFLELTARAALTTLAYAVVGASLAVAIGAFSGVLASEVWWETVLPPAAGLARVRTGLRSAARLLLALPRGLHEAIWGLLLILVLGLDPLAAILAIGLPYGAITGKVFSELLDEQPRGALHALRDAGARPLAALCYGLIPRALPDLLSYAFYRFECSIRAAAVLGLIGAGGLGYQLLLSLQSLRYRELWTLLAALLLLNGATDLWSGRVRRALGRTVNPRFRPTGQAPPPRTRESRRAAGARRTLVASAAAWLVLLPLSWWSLSPELSELVAPRTATRALDLLSRAWPPDLQAVAASEWSLEILRTMAMSIVAIALAFGLAMLLAGPAARTVASGSLAGRRVGFMRAMAGAAAFGAARALLLLLRTIPAPVWALLLLFVLFPGILPGAIALGLYTAGIVGRLSAEVIENLDPGPARALATAGAPSGSALLYGLAPTALPRITAYTLYRWEECVRATAIVGVVGAGGLGQLLEQQRSAFDFDAMSATLLIFILLTLGMDGLSGRVRRSLR
jgi:phosphonate transport system permease protein